MVKWVIKRDGHKELFQRDKIYHAVFSAAQQILNVEEAKTVAEKVSSNIIHSLRDRRGAIDIENIQDMVEDKLMVLGFPEVAKVYILYRRYREEIRLSKLHLGIRDELKLSLNAINVLKKRYLLRNDERKIVETPKEMFYRVADYIAQAEKRLSSNSFEYYRDRFFDMMKNLEFLPNSPTLVNAATALGQLSACFVLPVPDSIEGIFDTLKYMGVIHKSGGGTGFSFSSLRPAGDIVNTTKGEASGPLSFMRIFDTATGVIMQGGRRRGANMAVLEISHPDIEQFIEAKLDNIAFPNFNISIGITDKFMRAFRYNYDWSLINPRTGKVTGRVKARRLFANIVFCAHRSGDPGLVFLDTINRKHPLKELGRIEATNPCGEVPLLSYEACNLGSLNLSKFVKNKKIDWLRLKETVRLGVRFLDNVIEVNHYPLREIEDITTKNRKIGLGVMGFADMLIKLRIPYDSKDALKLAASLMRFIRKNSLKASQELAQERGVFPNWKYSIYKKKNVKLRNATLNSIAPTGTISIIANCSSGIEPIFAISFVRNVLGGNKLFEYHSLLEEIVREEGFNYREIKKKVVGKISIRKTRGLPTLLKNIFATTFDIAPLNHLKLQAVFQRFVDNAVSKTINLPKEATVDDIEYIYRKAYELNLKGITVYRYGSKSKQVLEIDSAKQALEVDEEYGGGCFSHICPS